MEDPLADCEVGCNVILETTLGEQVSGTIFALDRSAECVVLSSSDQQPGHTTLRLIKCNYIKNLVNAQKPTEDMDMTLPVLDASRTAGREKKALEEAEKQARKIGDGVSQEAQQVFDALSKTLPCEWDGSTIVVFGGEARIGEPYNLNAVQVDTSHRDTADRIKFVLSQERKKMSLEP